MHLFEGEMKMDRRNYLLRMGTGAAGIIGASVSNIFGQESKKTQQSKKTNSQNIRTRAPARNLKTGGVLKWPVTNTLPSQTAFVTGFFAGLIGFCYDDTNSGDRFIDVGFHPGAGGHRFEIFIYRKMGSRCNLVKQYTPRSRSLEFGLRSSGPGPNVFQTSGSFDRNRTGNPYDYDFRWLPDLDGADFYPENYQKNARYPIRLKVTHGTFYTRMHTLSTFKLVDADSQDCETEFRDLGHVALYMAVAIDTQSTVFLTEADPLQWAQGVSYHVVFKNECDGCRFDVNDCNEAKRNDFHFSRKVVKVPNNRLKYGLRLKLQGCSGAECPPPDFCYPEAHRLTDEAPCMGSGFGQTSGFP
jgi:hypothetical protein